MSKAIESRIERNDWRGARRLIRSELRRKPRSHWLLTRLALTYYERRDYRRSLATVTFSGMAPGFVSLYQVNVQVGATTPVGDAINLVLTIGGVASNTVTIAVN